MIRHGVECERGFSTVWNEGDPPDDAYLCRWEDRFTLAKGLISEGKNVRISPKGATSDADGKPMITHAWIEVVPADVA